MDINRSIRRRSARLKMRRPHFPSPFRRIGMMNYPRSETLTAEGVTEYRQQTLLRQGAYTCVRREITLSDQATRSGDQHSSGRTFLVNEAVGRGRPFRVGHTATRPLTRHDGTDSPRRRPGSRLPWTWMASGRRLTQVLQTRGRLGRRGGVAIPALTRYGRVMSRGSPASSSRLRSWSSLRCGSERWEGWRRL